MRKVHQALERLEAAAVGVEAQASGLSQAQLQAADLRGEIASLKRENKDLKDSSRRAALRVEKALAKLDELLTEGGAPSTLPNTDKIGEA